MLENFERLLNNMVQTAVTMGLLLIGLWVIYFIDAVFMNGDLKQRFGIRPRSRFNPLAIVISPFLHVDRRHLAANSVPFFILGSLVLIQGEVVFWVTTLVIILVAGLGIWLFGRPGTLHVGASGLILGYFGSILSSIFFAPDLATIILAVVVAVLYLGLIKQVVPLKQGVSTMGHLFGFLGGIAAAWLVALIPPG